MVQVAVTKPAKSATRKMHNVDRSLVGLGLTGGYFSTVSSLAGMLLLGDVSQWPSRVVVCKFPKFPSQWRGSRVIHKSLLWVSGITSSVFAGRLDSSSWRPFCPRLEIIKPQVRKGLVDFNLGFAGQKRL